MTRARCDVMAVSQDLADNPRRWFRTDGDIRKAIQELVRCDGDLRVAVAYWGKCGAEHTGIADRVQANAGEVYILCDLGSGACNPSEIEKLWKNADKIKIKTLDELHAKVWIGEDRVIVGSANASTSGLADETELGSNIEAALMVENRELAQALNEWFKRLWRDADPVTAERLSKARDLWNRRRKAGGRAEPTPEELLQLRKKLVNRVARSAEGLWQSDKSPDITLRSVRSCQDDPGWRRGYKRFIGDDPAGQAKRRDTIHPLFGKTVRARLRAKAGKSGVDALEEDLLGSYTELHPDE